MSCVTVKTIIIIYLSLQFNCVACAVGLDRCFAAFVQNA